MNWSDDRASATLHCRRPRNPPDWLVWVANGHSPNFHRADISRIA